MARPFRHLRILLALAMLAAGACSRDAPLAATSRPSSPVPIGPAGSWPAATTDSGAHQPAKPAGTPLVQVMMFQMLTPFGTVTYNAGFWKHIDEDCVGVAAYDNLLKNGLRVGRGRVDDWPYFKDILDQNSTVCQTTQFAYLPGQELALNVTPPMPEQTLFVFNEHGVSGRMFDACVNQLSFKFDWEPRMTKTVRLQVCPVVLSQRQNDFGMGSSYEDSEHLYNLGLWADIAPGQFLIIAPSPDAEAPDRVGHRFLVQDRATARYEELLILVGQNVKQFDKAHSPTTQPEK